MWRSRVLDVADVPGLRPTSERIRETLFNWLSPRIEGTRCLDLYAGSGALGFEALSRGAKAVVFVETAAPAIAMLRKNAGLLKAEGADIRKVDAIEFLSTTTEKFDVVFLDPPFAENRLNDLCRLIDERGVLAGGGRVYLEQDRTGPVAELPAGWTVLKEKTAGNVRYALAVPATEQGRS